MTCDRSSQNPLPIASYAIFSIIEELFNFVQRFVPFVAVAAANWVNIPLMRQNELTLGTYIHSPTQSFKKINNRPSVIENSK